jgi:hypothetical protein
MGGNITLRSKVLPEDIMRARVVRFTAGIHCLLDKKMSRDYVLNTFKLLHIFEINFNSVRPLCLDLTSEVFPSDRCESDVTLKTKTKLSGLSPHSNYTDRETAACRRSWCQINIGFLDPEPLLFHSSSSSFILTRLSGLRSRPTTSQKIW